jgi:hypothetical protein
MNYANRAFFFAAMAATVWAQQSSQSAAEAEAALHRRAEQFFQLQVDKKFRQAEAMVADDTKENYYNGNKFNIKTFTIQGIELLENNTRAKVTIRAKVTMMMAGVPPMDFESPSTTLWKIEDGKWVWYIDSVAAVQTPFGAITAHDGGTPSALDTTGKAPDISTLRTSVKIDRSSVELTPNGQPQTVTVSNELPGGVDLELRSDRITGLSAQLEKKHLEAGEKTVISFQASAESEGSGVVRLIVSPIASEMEIRVKID